MAPSRDSAAARLVLTVDLPTPPLPAATAMMFFTPGSRGFDGWLGRPTHRGLEAHVDGADAGQLADRAPGSTRDDVLRRAGRRGQLDVDDRAAAVDGDRA